MVRIIFVEGNVASGKTTAIKYLRQKSGKVLFVEEPVEHWQNLPKQQTDEKINLLDHFYQDITKYGFCFQTYAFLSRMKYLMEMAQKAKEEDKEVIVCERSIFTDREIFLESLFDGERVTEAERTVYHHLWDFWIGLMQPYFEHVKIHFLYLQCPPEKALVHLKSRSRSEETGVQLDYLSGLHQKHEELYQGVKKPHLQSLVAVLQGSSEPVKVQVMDNGGTPDEYFQRLDDWWEEIHQSN